MKIAEDFIDYLRANELRFTTAESCTAGMIIALLTDIQDSGSQCALAHQQSKK